MDESGLLSALVFNALPFVEKRLSRFTEICRGLLHLRGRERVSVFQVEFDNFERFKRLFKVLCRNGQRVGRAPLVPEGLDQCHVVNLPLIRLRTRETKQRLGRVSQAAGPFLLACHKFYFGAFAKSSTKSPVVRSPTPAPAGIR